MKTTKKVKRQAKRLFHLCLVKDQVDERRLREVVEQVAAGTLRNRPAILEQLLRLMKLDQARYKARIESAVRLPADVESTIRSSLARRYASDLATDFVVNPVLIGGLRIQVGSDVYDGSVRAGLAALEKGF